MYCKGISSDCIVGHCDADYAGDVSDRKSITGYLCHHGDSLLSWRSKKQSVVAQSTQEPEYIALPWATREVIRIRGLFAELDGVSGQAVTIFCHNQAAINLSHNEILNERTNLIDTKYHFTRDAIEKKWITVDFLSFVG